MGVARAEMPASSLIITIGSRTLTSWHPRGAIRPYGRVGSPDLPVEIGRQMVCGNPPGSWKCVKQRMFARSHVGVYRRDYCSGSGRCRGAGRPCPNLTQKGPLQAWSGLLSGAYVMTAFDPSRALRSLACYVRWATESGHTQVRQTQFATLTLRRGWRRPLSGSKPTVRTNPKLAVDAAHHG